MSGCLLLTRQAADNQRLAARFAAEGVETCSVPLLELRPCEEGPVERQYMLDLDRYHAVVVVSPTAARLGLERRRGYSRRGYTGSWHLLSQYMDAGVPGRDRHRSTHT